MKIVIVGGWRHLIGAPAGSLSRDAVQSALIAICGSWVRLNVE